MTALVLFEIGLVANLDSRELKLDKFGKLCIITLDATGFVPASVRLGNLSEVSLKNLANQCRDLVNPNIIEIFMPCV